MPHFSPADGALAAIDGDEPFLRKGVTIQLHAFQPLAPHPLTF